MKIPRVVFLTAAVFIGISFPSAAQNKLTEKIDLRQVPTWSKNDLNFFLHGSMSTEIIPETVYRAFTRTYPDLFRGYNLYDFGLIPDGDFGWPIGISRSTVKHLGGLSAIGINCASCHVSKLTPHLDQGKAVIVLGVTSSFDVEAFYGAILVSTFRTSDPTNMKRFLGAYAGVDATTFETAWQKQENKIVTAMKDDPFGAKDIAAGALHDIAPADVRLDQKSLPAADLAAIAHAMLKLFHNMRAALHVPDLPPEKPPPSSGPGRNDAFGLLSAALLNAPQPYAPTKFGLVWNVGKRRWVHWDGNTRSPIARNLLAALGLGAPLNGNRGDLDFALIKRHTDLTENILPPHYPFPIDEEAVKRGGVHFQANCASCHTGEESDARLYSISEVGTDPLRAQLFTQEQADRFNKFLAKFEAPGYEAPKEVGVRSTGKYFAPTLNGVWARAPYLHNGSVQYMKHLLMTPTQRPKGWWRGSAGSGLYDFGILGYLAGGSYHVDAKTPGNSNSGHDYGTKLSAAEKQDLIEYLKTL